MSWLGVKYALACRDERVKGSNRLVLAALGVRVEYRRITTSPTSLGEMRWLTFMSPEQLRRILDKLEEWGKVRRLSRGKNAVYALPEMAGPLFAIDDGDPPVKMTDFVIDHLPTEIGRDVRRVTGSRRRMTDFAGRLPLSTSGTSERSTSEQASAAAFVEWFRAAYREHRGADYQLKRDRAEEVARELLERRSPERLQAMALAMFQDVDDPWLNRAHPRPNDRSLFSLRTKAQYLESAVVANQRPDINGHYPRCRTWQECNDKLLHEGRQAAKSRESA